MRKHEKTPERNPRRGFGSGLHRRYGSRRAKVFSGFSGEAGPCQHAGRPVNNGDRKKGNPQQRMRGRSRKALVLLFSKLADELLESLAQTAY